MQFGWKSDLMEKLKKKIWKEKSNLKKTLSKRILFLPKILS